MTKRCSQCSRTLPAEAFYRDARNRDGLQSQCKDCMLAGMRAHHRTPTGRATRHAYQRTPAYRAAKRAYDQKPARKAALRAYKQTPAVQAAQRAYRQSPGGKAVGIAKTARYRAAHPDRCAAHTALRHAIIAGTITRPTTCSACHTPCTPDGHHESYLPQHRLNVCWLCRPCHTKLHVRLSLPAEGVGILGNGHSTPSAPLPPADSPQNRTHTAAKSHLQEQGGSNGSQCTAYTGSRPNTK